MATVLLTDHGSTEGSSEVIAAAIRRVTGACPIVLDAREFMTGARGRLTHVGGQAVFEVPPRAAVRADAVVVYDVRPQERARFAPVLRAVGGDPAAWRRATDKAETLRCFRAAGVPHAETVALRTDCAADEAVAAWTALGRDAWARPVVGLGGRDVSHVTSPAALAAARARFAASAVDWLLSRDAGNLDEHGHRHQYRVIVLGQRVLRFVEHVQYTCPDAPLNESHGASSITRQVHELPAHCREMAVAATRALGLAFGGVDLAPERGGAVFEVNVHPTLALDSRLESVAVPYVRAQLDP